MARFTALGLLLAVALLVSSGNASEGAPVPEPGWRSGYEGQNTPMDALGDLDEIAGLLGEMLNQLEAEGKLDASTKREVASWFENTEEEYMDRWFGDEGKFTLRFTTNPNSTPHYDRQFREQTRGKVAKER